MPSIAFTSVGCKLNRYEIQLMSEKLRPFGFVTVPFCQAAECYVINTCSVTSDADLSSRQFIRRARRRAPEAKIVATGCYAHLRPEEMRELGADLVVSNVDKEKIGGMILKMFGFGTSETDGRDHAREESIITAMNGLTRAFVKIEDGCGEKCTFCTIWLARGPVTLRPVETIIREINALAGSGHKEVALTGVHIGKYSFGGLDLTGLLKKLADGTSIERIRLSSLNPTEINDELIALMASNSRICPHIHLSMQSGDDDILKAMGRKYTTQNIASALERLTSAIPSITIGADILVGFPGETERKFLNTYELVKSSEVHHLHVFPYSDRPGTAAQGMIGKIPPAAKASRTEALRRLGKEKKQAHLGRFVGKKLSVLIENRDRGDGDYLTGLSENYLRVMARGDASLKGQIVDIWPDKVADNILVAESLPAMVSGRKPLTMPGRANIILGLV